MNNTHVMGPTTLNHGESQCVNCKATNREIDLALGPVCPNAPTAPIMTEPTTESHDEALAFSAALVATGRDALSDDAIWGVALAVDPLVQMFRTLPLNGDAGCDKLTDAEWLTVANAARDYLRSKNDV